MGLSGVAAHEPTPQEPTPADTWLAAPPTVVLPVRGPWQPLVALRSLTAHDVPGSTTTDLGTASHVRLLTPEGPPRTHATGDTTSVRPTTPHLVAVTLRTEVVEVRTPEPPWPGLADVVSRWFRLDDDTRAAERHLATDRHLAPLVAARPGLRPLGHPAPFEAAVTAVLGQQVSLAAARTFAGRLVSAFGSPGPSGLLAFPGAPTLAAVPVDELRAALGVTGSRARTVAGLAQAVTDGLDLREARRDEMLALPGVGPWTADVLALRLGADDVVCAGDLVLRRALGLPDARAVERRAAAWSPYRSTALWHLWAGAVYA